MTFCLVKFMRRQYEFSLKTFGPVSRTLGPAGPLNHLQKELIEIAQDPGDVTEWADGLLLLLDGAMRSGHSPNKIVKALDDTFARNVSRKWPDWRTAPVGVAIEHDRSHD